MWDLALVSDTQTVGRYCLRIVKSDGQLLSSYAVIPEIALTGNLEIELVDVGGLPSALPIQFSNVFTGTSCQVSAGLLGTSEQRIQITNNSSSASWVANIAPAAGASATWDDGAKKYDLNDPAGCVDSGDTDIFGGNLTVNPGTGTMTPYSGCSTVGVATGSASTFSEGSIDSILVASASSSAERFCSWSLTNTTLTQAIPPGQPMGAYGVVMVLTVLSF